MQNDNTMINTLDDLSFILSNKTVADTLSKLFNGEYVTDKERKEGMKATVDMQAKIDKSRVRTDYERQLIDNQANAIKTFIDSIREVNF